MNVRERAIYTILKKAAETQTKAPSLTTLSALVKSSVIEAQYSMSCLERDGHIVIFKLMQGYRVRVGDKMSKCSRIYNTKADADTAIGIDPMDVDTRREQCLEHGEQLAALGYRYQDVKLKTNRNPRRMIADRHSYGVAEYG